MVESRSRFTIIANLARKSADEVSMAILKRMERMAAYRNKFQALASGNGKEFILHACIDLIFGCQPYFGHIYSSQEKGLNENTNGLIRQFFPKRTYLDKILEVELKLNRRPRKCLDTKAPNEIFLDN